MSTLQLDIGGGATNPVRFTPLSSSSPSSSTPSPPPPLLSSFTNNNQTTAHPNNSGEVGGGAEEVAIDYSKSSTNRMSPDEGQELIPARRVPTKGMRKAYPEDHQQQLSQSVVTAPQQTSIQNQSNNQYQQSGRNQNQQHQLNNSTPSPPVPAVVAAATINSNYSHPPKIMDHPHQNPQNHQQPPLPHQQHQSSPSPYYQQQHSYHNLHENDTPSPYYPTPPPYNSGGSEQTPLPSHYVHQQQQQQQQIPPSLNNRFNFNHAAAYPQEIVEDVRECQCLKCGLFFSCESDLHMHYTHDHGYGQQNNMGGGGGGGGERSSTSSTNSSGGGGHPHHIASRYHHNSSSTTSSRTSANSNNQDMFCDKCQLRFHCLLSFRVHQHEHVLPNVQPHYPMSNSHLLSLSYSCEICGANFMSRESLTDHANAHLFEHVCSESTCGGESEHTNSSEDFYSHQQQQQQQQQQREQMYNHSRQTNPNQGLHYQQQKNYYNQSAAAELENDERDSPQHQHNRRFLSHNLHHQQQVGSGDEDMEESRILAAGQQQQQQPHQGPNNFYSTQPEYSTPNNYAAQHGLYDFHEEDDPQHEVSPPISNSKFGGGSGGTIYEPLIVMDNGKRRFQCVICKKHLSSRIAHEEHTRGKHTGDKPYSCSYCGKRFAVWNTYKHHMGTHKSGLAPPLQKCSYCAKQYKTVECLRNHMQREHGSGGGVGGGGRGGTGGGGEAENGSNNGSSSGGYSCQICGKTFVRKMWRTRHYLSHAGQNCFRCELCSCILPDEQSYRMHHESHKVSN